MSSTLISGMTSVSVMNGSYRPQHPDMCLQHGPFRTLPPSQDANGSSKRESQKNGHHVGVREFGCFESHLARRGNVLVIVSTTSVVVGLTWGGVRYPWLSAHVLSPLIIGLIGLGVFIIYEVYLCKPPVVSPSRGMRRWLSTGPNIHSKVPIVFRTTWTGASGYFQNFVAAVVFSTLSCTLQHHIWDISLADDGCTTGRLVRSFLRGMQGQISNRSRCRHVWAIA